MVAAYSNKDEAHNKSIDKLVEENKIGGLIFFQGGPVRQAKLTNRYQAKSKVPMFIGIDAEWGLSMRLDSTYRYPWNMTLGAIQDMKLIEKAGNQMAKMRFLHFPKQDRFPDVGVFAKQLEVVEVGGRAVVPFQVQAERPANRILDPVAYGCEAGNCFRRNIVDRVP